MNEENETTDCGQAAADTAKPEESLRNLAKAFGEELGRAYARIDGLEARLSRIEGDREAQFQAEAVRRLGIGGGPKDCCGHAPNVAYRFEKLFR